MSDWKLHTPIGVNDLLPEECGIKKDIENTIWTVFTSAGYNEVETPAFEYYDCYIGEGGQISQETMYKFFDEQGRILALRPDFTTSIARMAATKESDKQVPLRYMYTGNVYRRELTEGARQREITQTGIELIGSYSPMADAEVIACAIEAIMAVGIEEFSMEIGQVAFFNGLVDQAGLDAKTTERLRERIDSKDSVGIKNIVRNLNISNDVKQLMIDLPYMFGDKSVLEKADIAGLNYTSKIALDNLNRIYDLLCLYGFEKYISIDLGMLQSIDYYTGSIFKCYTQGVGFPICAGGRYDNLMAKFGAPKGAVGVAIGIGRIMQAVKGKGLGSRPGSTLVFAEPNADGIAYEVAYGLRVNGCLVEMYIGDGDFKDAKKYAKLTKQECILRTYPDGRLKIVDLMQNTEIDTTVNEFLGYSEDIPEPTPQDLGFRKF